MREEQEKATPSGTTRAGLSWQLAPPPPPRRRRPRQTVLEPSLSPEEVAETGAILRFMHERLTQDQLVREFIHEAAYGADQARFAESPCTELMRASSSS